MRIRYKLLTDLKTSKNTKKYYFSIRKFTLGRNAGKVFSGNFKCLRSY